MTSFFSSKEPLTLLFYSLNCFGVTIHWYSRRLSGGSWSTEIGAVAEPCLCNQAYLSQPDLWRRYGDRVYRKASPDHQLADDLQDNVPLIVFSPPPHTHTHSPILLFIHIKSHALCFNVSALMFLVNLPAIQHPHWWIVSAWIIDTMISAELAQWNILVN